MLKSRGRTDEIFVMKMEEWPQVNCKSFLHYSVEHKDYEYEQKGHYPKKGVMPCAKSKAGTKR